MMVTQCGGTAADTSGSCSAPIALACSNRSISFPCSLLRSDGSRNSFSTVAAGSWDAEGSSGPARRGRQPAGVDAGAVRPGCRGPGAAEDPGQLRCVGVEDVLAAPLGRG